MAVDPARLPREYPRRFVPDDADLGDWAQIEPLFDQLDHRPIDTRDQLETWLADWSELIACIHEEGSLRHIRMTIDTENEDFENAYLHFISEIQPKLKSRQHALQERYVNSPARAELSSYYHVLDRSTENDVELFREDNVPLETEDQKLGQRYQKLTGAMTVEFQGEERTLQQMARFLEEPQRDVRQQAWELVTQRRLQDREAINELYDQMLQNRQKRAENAGFEDFRDYAFRLRERFDYGPEDCVEFQNAVEAHIVPLKRELEQQRQDALGVEALRPWDLEVDPHNRDPLRPFSSADELIDGCVKIFGKVDLELGSQFQQMADLGLLDLESRKGKAPGGYQAMLAERRFPFIFMNAVGRNGDLRTLLHEGGHAFHTFAARDEPLVGYRHAPTEFAEVASMSMELLSHPHWEVFYDSASAERARQDHLERIADILPWIATIDAFQHWIYTNPGHSAEQREDKWLELRVRFGGVEDWSDYETARRNEWHRQLHLFLIPFYYIEYGIAQLGALGMWLQAQADPQNALGNYRSALALGGSRPLPELFEAAGLSFDFGEAAVRQAAQGLRDALAT